jgi:predicted dehydrogenase
VSGVPKIRIAILGCGAVTERAYLPVLKRMHDARVTVLIDTNAKRLEHLASKFNVEYSHSSFDGCYDLFDAAIVALPHALHAAACIKLLAQGKAVLVEKPMAISVAECDDMIRAADQTGTLLAVGLTRRFMWAHRLAQFLLTSEALGRVESFDFREGFIYSWPVASDFFLRKETAGGGVLFDTGAHTLDCLLHWLGDFSEVEYFDDAEGGVEANCLINVRLRNGVCGVVELSRTRQLRNSAVIRCERGMVEVGLFENQLELVFADQPYVLGGPVSNLEEPGRSQIYVELMRPQVENFVAAIRNNRKPEVDGEEAKLSIRLIEACYRKRKRLQLPWMREGYRVIG